MPIHISPLWYTFYLLNYFIFYFVLILFTIISTNYCYISVQGLTYFMFKGKYPLIIKLTNNSKYSDRYNTNMAATTIRKQKKIIIFETSSPNDRWQKKDGRPEPNNTTYLWEWNVTNTKYYLNEVDNMEWYCGSYIKLGWIYI